MSDLLKGCIMAVSMTVYAAGGMWLISLVADWEPRSLGAALWLTFLGGLLIYGGYRLCVWLGEKIEPNRF